jgi:CubicO group peptidase (beta-lactamase class C family)
MRTIRTIITALLAVTALSSAVPAKLFAQDFSRLETVMDRAVRDSVFPGASLAVIYRGKIVFHKAFGHLTYEKKSAPADTTTIYDAASLTKAVVTSSIVMQLAERDSLDLHAPVDRYRPGFTAAGKGGVTIEQLMRHTSGLRAHTFFSAACRNPDEVLTAIEKDSLSYQPGTKTVYSDLGFIMLGRIVESRTGNSLASNFHARFSGPLDMRSTMFLPPAELLPRIAPTEPDAKWPLNTARPLVNDQNAALLGGVAGHAGLFTTTGDLCRMVRMLMNGGSYGGKTFIRPETVRMFLQKSDSPRAIGWDMVTPGGSSSAGSRFSGSSWGHLGYTGTSIWVDPEKELAVILLSNRVWPSSENIRIRKFRPLLHDTIIECIEKEELKKL